MSDDQPVIDFPEALGRTLGDVEFLKSMLFEFQKIAPDFLHRMHGALNSGNMAQLSKDAHQFKGSAANLGIKIVAALAGELEQIGAQGRPGSAPQVLERLKDAIDAYNTVLNQTDFATLAKDCPP